MIINKIIEKENNSHRNFRPLFNYTETRRIIRVEKSSRTFLRFSRFWKVTRNKVVWMEALAPQKHSLFSTTPRRHKPWPRRLYAPDVLPIPRHPSAITRFIIAVTRMRVEGIVTVTFNVVLKDFFKLGYNNGDHQKK